MAGRWRAAAALALVLGFAPAGTDTAAAQEPRFATPFVDADHWAVHAARRLDGIGLVPPGFDWGARALPARELARVFTRALERAESEWPAMVPRVAAYLARFDEEFGATYHRLKGAEAGLLDSGGRWAAGGYERRTGRLLAGTGYFNETDVDEWEWTGPRPFEDELGARAVVRWTALVGSRLAVSVTPEAGDGGLELEEGHLVGLAGRLGFWAGRRSPAFGPGPGGGLLFDGRVSLDGGGLFLSDPITPPGPLSFLGPARAELWVSRLDRNGNVERPWLAGARLMFSPDPRLGIGFTRGAIFGGDGDGRRVTARRLAYLLIGKHAGEHGEFENQVAAVDVRVLGHLGSVPVRTHIEWGMSDNSGGWKNVPAITAGVEAPALPWAPDFGAGFEGTFFARSCCGNPIWYRNLFIRGGWADDGRILGHPLGGHGREWAVFGRADLMEARLRAAGRVFVRRRGEENLFAPDRVGRSAGGSVGLRYRPLPGWELSLDGVLDDGAGWRQAALATAARLSF